MVQPLVIAKSGDQELALLPALANRHGLITGATGTGKTVTLQVLAERLSSIGVPVFLADVKGDLSGLGAAGSLTPKLKARLDSLGIAAPAPAAFPAVFWDVFGEAGHPVRATADDNGLLLLDLKDLRSMVQHVGDNAKQFTTEYGNISAASIGAIQRSLLALEAQGGEAFFGEPMLDIADLMQTDEKGRGVVNILAAEKLLNAPRLYATFLLWLLAELFEQLPEAGDLDKPKLAFFFDEAHLLFNEAPPALLEKIEQVVRLIRSKGVGVYFITQNPLDVPETVLGQLGNRVQHALRAFTPRDQKAVKTAAQTLRQNPKIDTEAAITEMGVGEALVSFLDEKGRPSVVERAFILPPASRIGPLSAEERMGTIKNSLLYGHYEKAVDRESAYEKLKARAAQAAEAAPPPQVQPPQSQPQQGGGLLGGLGDLFGGGSSRGGRQSAAEAAVKSAARAIGSELGRQVLRGVLGSILGGKRR
jgi:DNA helicase HerA-like ATPase